MGTLGFRRRCFARAWQETKRISGYSLGRVLFNLSPAIIGLGLHWYLIGRTQAMDEAVMILIYGLAAVGITFGFAFAVDLIRAPGQLYRELEQRAGLDAPSDRRARFDETILELRRLVTAKELWWRENHRRKGESVLYPRLIAAIDEIRRCFPPDDGTFADDPLTKLLSAAANLGSEYGWGHKDTTRLEARKTTFEAQIAQTAERFERLISGAEAR